MISHLKGFNMTKNFKLLPQILSVTFLLGGLMLSAPAFAQTSATPTAASAAVQSAASQFYGKDQLTQAKTACGGLKNVVWRSTNSKVYHLSTSSHFGTTKGGNYMCLNKAKSLGLRSAK